MEHVDPAAVAAGGFEPSAPARPLGDIFAALFPAKRPGHCGTARLLLEGKNSYLQSLSPRGGLEEAFAALVVEAAKLADVKGVGRSTVFRKLGWIEKIAPDTFDAVEGTDLETTAVLDALAKDTNHERQRALLKSLREPAALVVPTDPSGWRGDLPGLMDNESRFYVPDVFDADGRLLVPSCDLWRNNSKRVMPRLANAGRCADVVACDPPFGVARKDSDGRTIEGDADTAIAFWSVRLSLLPLKDDAYASLFASNGPCVCHVWEGEALARADRVDRVIWDKRQGSALGDPSSTFNPDVEHILICHKGGPKLRPWKNVARRLGEREDDMPSIFEDKADGALVQRDGVLWSIPSPRGAGPGDRHPSRKPVAICMRLLLSTSDEEDLVLDGFAGTAPIGVAAVRLRRRYIGVECQRDFFAEGVRRLKAALIAMYPEHFTQTQ